MTLPKITGEDGVDGDTIDRTTQDRKNESSRLGSSRRAPGTGVRARALKENHAYLAENLVWNDQLERSFVSLGLLREHVFGPVSMLKKLHDMLVDSFSVIFNYCLHGAPGLHSTSTYQMRSNCQTPNSHKL